MSDTTQTTAGRLAGKVALITGAGGGLGLAMAQAMAAEGAAVALADISGAQDTAAASIGEQAIALHADVTQEDDVRAMIDAAVERFGRLDVLCNNAGIDGDLVPLAEMTVENFDRVIAVNLRSVFLGLRYGIPALLAAGGGSVINMASVAAISGMPRGAAYAASKSGITGITRTAAVENAAAGVRVNAILPAVIQTPMADAVGADDPTLKGAIAATPAGRLGRPDEVASLAVYLASDESTFITGASLTVDGGYSAI